MTPLSPVLHRPWIKHEILAVQGIMLMYTESGIGQCTQEHSRLRRHLPKGIEEDTCSLRYGAIQPLQPVRIPTKLDIRRRFSNFDCVEKMSLKQSNNEGSRDPTAGVKADQRQSSSSTELEGNSRRPGVNHHVSNRNRAEPSSMRNPPAIP